MKIEKLVYFLSVAENLNFSKAAQDCHIAQPAMSKQIGALEKELGVTLFCRSGCGIQLTPSGSDFYQSISAFMKDYRECFCRSHCYTQANETREA